MVTTEEKRLLLNDPDVLVNRLNRVESILAILNATVKQQSTENQQMAVTIQQQNNMIKQQQTSIQKLQAAIQQQQTSTLQQQTLIQQHEQTIKQLQGSISRTQNFGATYIRWGRKQCARNNTELVYSGYAGGGYYDETGAAAEYVYTVVLAEEKRLLLNDPDVLVNRLNRLENAMVVLNSTLLQQSITIQQQSSTIQQQQTSIHQQELTIKQLQDTIKNSQRFETTYIRWGRTQCPNNNTELVYSGYVGGGIYSDSGAAAEYVCLPPDPNYVKISGGDYGRMYGGEFDSNFFASNSNDEDVPCALCRTNRASSVIMIPGKNSCYSGWKVEYHGYLASGLHTHAAASAYVCVDINPEYIIGGVDQHYGKLFYEVLSKCGALKCPPYINNYPLTCVVCSK